MHVMLKFELDCSVDAAWAAVRSPKVFRAVSSPFLGFTSLDPEGFPETWEAGDHHVEVKALGLIPIGEQVISISYPDRGTDVRILQDTGGGVRGPVELVTYWHHRMAVSPLADGRTLYRDKLVFDVGPVTLLVWPLFWLFWQWRGAGIRRFAQTWR